MRTSWQRDDGLVDRARLELDPWQVRLLEGYDPLYDYPSSAEVLHSQWADSELQTRARQLLGDDAVREATEAIAAAATIPALAKWKAADDANAAAWAQVPIEALVVDANAPRPAQAAYGVSLSVEGLRLEWVGPAHAADVSCHLAPFVPPVRLYSLAEVLVVPEAYLFLRTSGLPWVTTRTGEPLSVLAAQLSALGVDDGAFSRVFVNGAAYLGEHALLRLHSHQHACGAALATTGSSWWVKVDPRRGVVARSRR